MSGRTHIAWTAYCLTTLLLILVNRNIIASYHQYFTLFALQSLFNVVVCRAVVGADLPKKLISRRVCSDADAAVFSLDSFDPAKAKMAFWPAVVYFLIVVTNRLALGLVNITTIVVIRSAAILSIPALYSDAQPQSLYRLGAVAAIVLGTFIYGHYNEYAPTEFGEAKGVVFCIFNAALATVYAHLFKSTTTPSPSSSQSLPPSELELTYYFHLLLFPLNLLLVAYLREYPLDFANVFSFDSTGRNWILLSFPVTFVHFYSMFATQLNVSALSFVVTNNINKIPYLLAALFFFGQGDIAASVLGLLLSSLAALAYYFQRNPRVRK